MYQHFFKRILDIFCSAVALIVFSPIILVLTFFGMIAMHGNPFFVQQRPGKNEKIFCIYKFRTMTNKKDANGKLLSDKERLNCYGKFIRSTSLDELPELWNIFIGDMSLVGPRPLLVEYLSYYNEEQRHRHEVRPGLTGLAQINGRNLCSWEDKFKYDVQYVRNITFFGDVNILWKTIMIVLCRQGISSTTNATVEKFRGSKNDKTENE